MIRRSFLCNGSKAFVGINLAGSFLWIKNIDQDKPAPAEKQLLSELRNEILQNLAGEERCEEIALNLTQPKAIISHLDGSSKSSFEYSCDHGIRVKIQLIDGQKKISILSA